MNYHVYGYRQANENVDAEKRKALRNYLGYSPTVDGAHGIIGADNHSRGGFDSWSIEDDTGLEIGTWKRNILFY